MTFDTFMELVGYFASLLVLISLLMTSVVKLRIINSIGSMIYVVYALVIHSYPTALMNFGLVVINVYFLIRIRQQKMDYSLVQGQVDESATQHFLQVHRNDIGKFFPDYDFAIDNSLLVYFVYAGSAPAGLLLAKDLGDGRLGVLLDYSTPQYRDCSVGRFLYPALKDQGVRALVAQGGIAKHEEYMRKMNFQEQNGEFVKEI